MTKKLGEMAKAIVAAFTAAFAAYLPLVSTGAHHVTSGGWIAVAIAFVGGLAAVYITPNSPAANFITDLVDRLTNVESQLPNIPGISKAVADGVVAGLQTLGHILSPVSNGMTAAAAVPDPAPVETPAALLSSVAGINTLTDPVPAPPPVQNQ